MRELPASLRASSFVELRSVPQTTSLAHDSVRLQDTSSESQRADLGFELVDARYGKACREGSKNDEGTSNHKKDEFANKSRGKNKS